MIANILYIVYTYRTYYIKLCKTIYQWRSERGQGCAAPGAELEGHQMSSNSRKRVRAK